MKKLLLAAIIPLTLAVFIAYPAQTSDTAVSRETATTTAPVQQKPVVPYSNEQKQLVAAVEHDFSDVPQMYAIVRCESRFRQFQADGSPLISPTGDVGVAQINIKTWGSEAKALGLDIYGSAADNLAMARIVYEKQGLTAWTCYNLV